VLTEQDGAEMVRLLNELTTLAQYRSFANDVYVHCHVGTDTDEDGWRVKVFGLGDAPQEWVSSVGAKKGFLDALREEVAALQEQKAAERRRAKSPRAKPRPRRASR
jgi:hypothetical protein